MVPGIHSQKLFEWARMHACVFCVCVGGVYMCMMYWYVVPSLKIRRLLPLPSALQGFLAYLNRQLTQHVRSVQRSMPNLLSATRTSINFRNTRNSKPKFYHRSHCHQSQGWTTQYCSTWHFFLFLFRLGHSKINQLLREVVRGSRIIAKSSLCYYFYITMNFRQVWLGFYNNKIIPGMYQFNCV